MLTVVLTRAVLPCRFSRRGCCSKEEVERCKQKELLEEMLEEMAGDFPGLGEVFVNERDVFLCASLADASRVVPCNTLAGERRGDTDR